MHKRINKTAMINARVTRRMKQSVLMEAEQRGETEAMIVREALKEYFERRAIMPPRRTVRGHVGALAPLIAATLLAFTVVKGAGYSPEAREHLYLSRFHPVTKALRAIAPLN